MKDMTASDLRGIVAEHCSGVEAASALAELSRRAGNERAVAERAHQRRIEYLQRREVDLKASATV